jgi:hypothetical protein
MAKSMRSRENIGLPPAVKDARMCAESAAGSKPTSSDSKTSSNLPTPLPQTSNAGGSAEPRAISASGGSSFELKYGSRKVKAYPITEAELSEIGTLKGLSTFCFSLSSAAAGFGGNMIVSFLSASSANDMDEWKKISILAVIAFAVIFSSIGAYLTYKGNTKIAEIKGQASF